MANASREKAKLCEHIVADHFGPITAKVAGCLLQRGRLPLRDLTRFLSASGITSGNAQAGGPSSAAQNSPSSGSSPTGPLKNRRLIQAALLILVQHNCAWHAQLDEDGGGGAGATEYFEMNPDEVLARTRFGRYIGLAKEMWGDLGEEVISLILKNGKLQANDIIEQVSGGDTKKSRRVASFLRDQLFATYLRPSTLSQHTSPRDKVIAYERAARLAHKGIPTPKMLKEIKAQVMVRIAQETREEWEGAARGEKGETGRLGLKRKAAPSGNSKSKKQKVTSTTNSNKDAGLEDMEIDPTVFLRVHYERFDVHVRNDLIVEVTASKYNQMTAEVMRFMIDAGEEKSEKLALSDARSGTVSLTMLAPKLPESLSIQRGFDKKSFGKKTPSRTEFLSEYAAILSCQDDISPNARRLRFLAPVGTAGGGGRGSSSYTIEYENIASRAKRAVLRAVVDERFGSSATRIMNILLDKGKLEEKHIAKIAMLSMSETRDICSRLFASSLLELQEVPKSADRNPQRTFFLWHVNLSKAYAWLLDHLYKSLARLGQRRAHERARQAPLLAKCSRTDVKEDVAGLLSEWEKEQLERLNETLRALTIAEMRTERDVFIVRDLPG